MTTDLPHRDDISLVDEDAPILHRRIELFNFQEDERSPRIIRDLLVHGMTIFGGVGLSANQIGLDVRAFAAIIEGTPLVMFNPVIMELDAETKAMTEGCLSYPGLFLKIARPISCRVVYDDVDGERRSRLLHDFEARIVLHETDHLNGQTFIDKAAPRLVKRQIEQRRLDTALPASVNAAQLSKPSIWRTYA